MGRASRNAGEGLSTPKQFFDASKGRWAGERLAAAMTEGRILSTQELRTAGTLRSYEWVQFDNVVVQESLIRLRGVADLIANGLVKTVANGLGKTVFQYDKAGYMLPAQTSLDGMASSGDDREEFDLSQIPLPITHKDFRINLRTLMASRNPVAGGSAEPLDTMQARIAARTVAEQVESMLFAGGPVFGGLNIYGYTTHPDRNTASFGTNGAWSAAAKLGENILADLFTAITGLQGDRFFGPYAVYVPTNTGMKLEDDFKANGSLSIRQRMLQVDGVKSVTVCDQLAADNIVVVQLTEDVTCLVEGEPVQTIQWDIEGGMMICFKVMCIQVPLIRSTKANRCGVFHMS